MNPIYVPGALPVKSIPIRMEASLLPPPPPTRGTQDASVMDRLRSKVRPG